MNNDTTTQHQAPIEVIEFCQKNNLNACETGVIERVCNHRIEGGQQDLETARRLIDLAISIEYPESEEIHPDNWPGNNHQAFTDNLLKAMAKRLGIDPDDIEIPIDAPEKFDWVNPVIKEDETAARAQAPILDQHDPENPRIITPDHDLVMQLAAAVRLKPSEVSAAINRVSLGMDE